MKEDNYIKLCIPHTRYSIGIYSENLLIMDTLGMIFSPYVYQKEKANLEDIQIKIDYNSCNIVICTGMDCKKLKLHPQYELGQICGIIRYIQRTIEPWNLYHGAAMFIKGKTIAFLGDSGTGKTTLVAYLLNCCKDAICLSEDVLIINTEKNVICPYQRPLFLRDEGLHILQEEYQLSIDDKLKISYGNYSRYVIENTNLVSNCYYIDAYIKLNRVNAKDPYSMNRIEEGKADMFISGCYLPRNIKNNIICSMRLAKRASYIEVNYSKLDTILQNICHFN